MTDTLSPPRRASRERSDRGRLRSGDATPRVVDAALVERYAAAGVERTIVWLPPDSADVALQVMDAAAVSLCKENGLPIIVLNLENRGAVARAIRGDRVGTLVS